MGSRSSSGHHVVTSLPLPTFCAPPRPIAPRSAIEETGARARAYARRPAWRRAATGRRRRTRQPAAYSPPTAWRSNRTGRLKPSSIPACAMRARATMPRAQVCTCRATGTGCAGRARRWAGLCFERWRSEDGVAVPMESLHRDWCADAGMFGRCTFYVDRVAADGNAVPTPAHRACMHTPVRCHAWKQRRSQPQVLLRRTSRNTS